LVSTREQKFAAADVIPLTNILSQYKVMCKIRDFFFHPRQP